MRLNSLQLTTGGNVCNTGIAMARLGMTAAAAGMVGDDVLGKALLERLVAAGMDTSAVVTSTAAQTSATVVAVEPGGERCFFHTPGVTPLLDADVFRRCFPIFKQCEWIQIGYFGLLPTLTPDLPGLLKELRQYAPETKIAFDTVNPPASPELLWPILQYVDLFAPSRTEAVTLTGDTDPAAMVARFLRHMPPSAKVAIKLDAEGCFVEQTVIPAYPVEVIDTTGAGDTWFAGLLTGMIKGMPIQLAARLANRAAADCCTALGASTNVRSFHDTLSRI